MAGENEMESSTVEVGVEIGENNLASDPQPEILRPENDRDCPEELEGQQRPSKTQEENYLQESLGVVSGQTEPNYTRNVSSSRGIAALSFVSLKQTLYDSSKDTFKAIQAKARHMVSQNKRRYQKDGFDLDLTYITDNIIAMGFPAGDLSSGIIGYVEGFYRNHMEDVINFLESKHQGKYKVYNLCSERLYDASLFQGKVACFPFDDHNCPPLKTVTSFCESCSDWLDGEEERVCVVHCKAGLGRTGLMVSSLMLHRKLFDTASEAIQFFNDQRTIDGKGLVLPSQKRYVHYFAKVLGELNGKQPTLKRCLLRGIKLHRCPYWIRPLVTISDQSGILFSSKKHPQTQYLTPDDLWRLTPRKGVVVFSLPQQLGVVPVQEDFKITFSDRNGDFSCWLHTGLADERTTLNTSQLDWFDKRQLGSPGFLVEVVLVPNVDSTVLPEPAGPSPQPEPTETKSVPQVTKLTPPTGATVSSGVFSAAATAFSAFQSLYVSKESGRASQKTTGSGEVGEELKPVGENANKGVEISENVFARDDVFSDSDDEKRKFNAEDKIGTEVPQTREAAEKLQHDGKVEERQERPSPHPQQQSQAPPLPSPTTDFRALAEASAADASVFTFGDEEEDEEE